MSKKPEVSQHLLFPTRVILLHYDDKSLNDQIYNFFREQSMFHVNNIEIASNDLNLLELSKEFPAFERLKNMFLEGLKAWLTAENLTEQFTVKMQMFPNYSKPGHYTLVHNHEVHVVGVYYVRTSAYKKENVLVEEDYATYWDQDFGSFILHPPNFTLNQLQSNQHAKLFPHEGLMILFPGHLWHAVAPNHEEYHRLAISVNFELENKKSNSYCSIMTI